VNSLERRLGVGLLLALVATFGLLFWAAVAAVASLSEAYVMTRLEHDAEALLGAVRVAPGGRHRLREGRITPIYQQPLSGHYFVITYADGVRQRSRSLWDATLEPPAVTIGEIVTYRSQGPAGQQLLVRAAGYEKNGLAFGLTVAEDLSPLTADLRRFQRFALAGLGLALVVVLLSQRYVLRRSFRTLDRVRAEMREVAAGGRTQLQTLGPSEIRPLTREVNRLLQQLQQRLTRSRRALGNLAHALKSPLSLVTHDIDALPLPPTERERISGRLERLTALIERELKRAQFAGEGGGQHFLPARDVPELLDALRRLYRRRHLQIVSNELPTRALPLDYEDMLELLGNLLDNACKWARSQIELTVQVGRDLTVQIADDGPGVDEADRARLLQRGARLDEQEGGSGLGLAIVSDLVAYYGGTIVLKRADGLGGLLVVVTLPLPRDEDLVV
jgi:signal transduction histidine kinase